MLLLIVVGVCAFFGLLDWIDPLPAPDGNPRAYLESEFNYALLGEKKISEPPSSNGSQNHEDDLIAGKTELTF